MIQRIKRRKYEIYAFDIETHNDEESIRKQETSMWLGCFINEESTINDDVFFYDMDSFIDKLDEMTSKKRKKTKGKNEKRPCNNLCIYIYNLSFEWSFILPVLLKRGFHFSLDKDAEMSFNSVSTKSVSSVWQVNMKFKKNSGQIILRDLAKMYGGGLGKVAEAFHLPTQKGEIDYTENRLHRPMVIENGKEHIYVTDEEKDYCFKDVKILMDILVEVDKRNDKDFWNNCSMASYSMSRLMKFGFRKTFTPYKEYRKSYPELGAEESAFLRNSVAGGITYATDKWQFVEVNAPIFCCDAHQMHPSQIYSKPFPYGEGTYFTGKPTCLFKHINCCHIRISYTGVKLHSVIQLIGCPMIVGRELYVWDFEIPTMKKVYENLEIEFIDGYCYKARFLPWRNYVYYNYQERLKAKAEGNDFLTLLYKLLNNAGAYGKFLENPHNEIFKNTINALGIIDSDIEAKSGDDVRVNAKYTYLPVGSCIPAYSRVCLVEHAIKLCQYDGEWHDNVLYFDTDSIFFLWTPKTKEIWETQFNHEDMLGGWAQDKGGIITKAQFTAPKRYKVEVNGKATIKAGGINFKQFKATKVDEMIKESGEEVDPDTRRQMIEDYLIPYEEINIVSSTWKVQRAYRVRGGTLIEFQDKAMSVQKKYIDIYNKNAKMIDVNDG